MKKPYLTLDDRLLEQLSELSEEEGVKLIRKQTKCLPDYLFEETIRKERPEYKKDDSVDFPMSINLGTGETYINSDKVDVDVEDYFDLCGAYWIHSFYTLFTKDNQKLKTDLYLPKAINIDLDELMNVSKTLGHLKGLQAARDDGKLDEYAKVLMEPLEDFNSQALDGNSDYNEQADNLNKGLSLVKAGNEGKYEKSLRKKLDFARKEIAKLQDIHLN